MHVTFKWFMRGERDGGRLVAVEIHSYFAIVQCIVAVYWAIKENVIPSTMSEA